MLKDILCRLPLPVKLMLGRTKSALSGAKRAAVASVDGYSDPAFPAVNTPAYRKGLKGFLRACAFSAEECADYVRWLYTDKIEQIRSGSHLENAPTIICVAKNERDKLCNFFDHYRRLGRFNYIFIDNGSTDGSLELLEREGAAVYSVTEPFCTNRKLAWINKVYSTIPNGSWTVLLDADELLTFHGYEDTGFEKVLAAMDRQGITTAGAVMVDMFSAHPVGDGDYLESYVYFENRFHEESSFYFNSVYGGIREREFKFGEGRMFLIKKHPVVKKDERTMLIHCHYIYPYRRNFRSEIYFALLHYKLFDSEIEKYRRIAREGSYEGGSAEYKNYIRTFTEKSYEEIFRKSEDTELYGGTPSLEKISCLRNVRELF